jgi:N-acetylglucosaminyldiphosphoundecaprenol N-acetyl-beta-D-mannosaminyltransferase
MAGLRAKSSSAQDSAAEQDPAPLGAAARASQLSPRDDFDRDVWCLLGLPIDVASVDHAVAEIDAAVRTGQKLSFVTPNVNWLVRVLKDGAARREVLEADLSFIDGAPLVAMAKMLGVPAPSRVAGADIFEALRRRPGFGARRTRVFFFGGRDGAGAAAVEALNKEQGGVEAVGCLNPGFGDVETMSAPEIIAEINAARPDFIVVALGAAKGQAWIDRNKDQLDAPVIAHLGAVVDFTAGGVARAPAMVKKLGLEWLWRIKEEPALWRRYFDDGAALVGIILRRLAPQLLAWRPRLNRSDASMLATADIRRSASRTTIVLSGAFTATSLAAARKGFRSAAATGGDVVLDFTAVTQFDRSFLGLILMLEKHVARCGRTLYVDGATARHRAILQANAMDYRVAAQKERTLDTGRAATA